MYLYRTVSVHDLFKAKVIVKVNYDEGGWWLQVEMFSAQSATSLAKCYFVIIFEAWLRVQGSLVHPTNLPDSIGQAITF